ncbi:hypothetical protein ACHWQZ_G016814 [Mnemiopsis leidyi]
MSQHDFNDEKVRQRNVAIGALLENADADCKKLISAYRPHETYKKNHAVMSHSIYTSAVIEKCLNYLNVQTRTSPGNDKIYKNKKLMVDRLILKIESCFPAVCDECAVEYSNSVNDTPLFTCFICWQGSHDCSALQEYKKECERLPVKALGSVWLCNGCRAQNALVPTNISKSLQEDVTSPPEDEGDATANDEEEDEGRPSPRRDLVSNEATSEQRASEQTAKPEHRSSSNTSELERPAGKICEGYKNHNCPHGVSGKREVNGRTCPNLHLRICRKYIRNGTRARGGCQKGEKCRFFHPKLCKNSVNRRMCTVLDCKFAHLKGTKRKEEIGTRQRHESRLDRTARKPASHRDSSLGLRRDVRIAREDWPTQGPRDSMRYIPEPRQGILRQPRQRSDSIISDASWRNTVTPTQPRPRERPYNSQRGNELSFLVNLIEDLKGTQKEMEQSIQELRQRITVPLTGGNPYHLGATMTQPQPFQQPLQPGPPPALWSQFAPQAPLCC